MAKCRHYNIYGLEADHSTELCILHSEDSKKSRVSFNGELDRHREAHGGFEIVIEQFGSLRHYALSYK